MKAIFIFRRDLRLEDNLALINALKSYDVIPIFIFTPEQISSNEYKSENAIQFMINSLEELNSELTKKGSKLHLFYGKNEDIISYVVSKYNIDALYLNKDYTPYSLDRDKLIERACKDAKVSFNLYEDYVLNPINSILNKDTYFKVFKAYYNRAEKREIPNPLKNNHKNYLKIDDEKEIDFKKAKSYYKKNNNMILKGGRREALKITKTLKDKLSTYEESRKYPSTDTSLLSAHLKFGTLSCREVYHLFKEDSKEFIRQLIWRDFWTCVSYFEPKVLRENYDKKFDNIKWKNDKNDFEKWKNGETGVPIIDAGMRQLKKTGSMHNRIRMLTASFLSKNLLIDWRLGAQHFARHLTDYCPMQNQNNWQSVIGSGISSLPWFRVMNPWLQQKQFDEEADYIKKWIPELEDVPEEDIHSWFKEYKYYKKVEYPKTMEYNRNFNLKN